MENKTSINLLIFTEKYSKQRGPEWVAKQIRYNRHLMDTASSLYFMEAMKVQHEENIDRMKRVIEMKKF